MDKPDLLAKFVACATAAATPHADALVRLGVSRGWLMGGAARFGVARIRTDGPFWEHDPHGAPVCVLPAEPLADLGDPLWPTACVSDLIAFRTTDPGKWWFRTGAAVLLNPEAVEYGQHFNEPVTIHPHPLDWLRAGGTGVVVLDWSACLALHLSGPPALYAADLALGERLDSHLNRPAPRHCIEVTARALEAA